MGSLQNNTKIVILALLGLCYVVFSLLQISSLSNQISKYKSETVAEMDGSAKVEPSNLDVISAEIAERLPENYAASDIILATMRYVHDNSLPAAAGEYEQYAFNVPVVLDKLVLASKGDSSEKPLLSCGPRSYAMRSILGRFNIYARLIQIYSDSFDTVQGHRLLEVFNPDFQRWETWDPLYGVSYVDRETRVPTDIMSLIFSDKNKFMPVGISQEGWDNTDSTRLKEHYFKSVLFEQDRGMPNSVLIINQSIFDMTKTFEGGLTFTEWAKHYYSYPRIILLPASEPQG